MEKIQEKQMKNIEEINKASLKKILTTKKIPKFFAGDTIKVGVRIVEGKRERIQYFEGVCIAKKNRSINSSFTVRKISFGEGVERTFALYSPIIGSIKVVFARALDGDPAGVSRLFAPRGHGLHAVGRLEAKRLEAGLEHLAGEVAEGESLRADFALGLEHWAVLVKRAEEIGRASCRERV